MITKQLIFDPASSPLSENDNVGAFLRSADGTLLTHTTVGGAEALDTNMAQFLGETTVAGLGIFDEDTAHVSGDAGQAILVVRNDAGGSLVDTDLDYSPLQVDSAGRLRVLADLTAAFDFTYAEDSPHTTGDVGAFTLAVRQDTLASSTSTDGDYAAFKVNARGALYTQPVGNVADDAADTENPVKVGSRATTGVLTAVANNDRADLLSDGFRRVYVNSGANVTSLATAVTVTTTATALPTTALTGRRTIIVQNRGSNSIFLGDSGVTTATGIEISKGGAWEGEVGDDVVMYAIIGSGTADTRVLELA